MVLQYHTFSRLASSISSTPGAKPTMRGEVEGLGPRRESAAERTLVLVQLRDGDMASLPLPGLAWRLIGVSGAGNTGPV